MLRVKQKQTFALSGLECERGAVPTGRFMKLYNDCVLLKKILAAAQDNNLGEGKKWELVAGSSLPWER